MNWLAFGLGMVCGAIAGSCLERALEVAQRARAANLGKGSLWSYLRPNSLARWGREADSAANEERARRAVEMDVRE